MLLQIRTCANHEMTYSKDRYLTFVASKKLFIRPIVYRDLKKNQIDNYRIYI